MTISFYFLNCEESFENVCIYWWFVWFGCKANDPQMLKVLEAFKNDSSMQKFVVLKLPLQKVWQWEKSHIADSIFLLTSQVKHPCSFLDISQANYGKSLVYSLKQWW